MDLRQYLRPTEFIDSDARSVQEFARECAGAARDAVERAVRLYLAVRDSIRYDVYGVDIGRTGLRASSVLQRRVGLCIHKAIVLAAAARAVGIPSRLGFADVRNHLATRRLVELVGGDVFHYHAYMELFLEGRWVKATPAFNAKLCRLFGVAPLEFDGRHDSVLQPFDAKGNRYMEFLRHHGVYGDFPYDMCIGALRRLHPRLFGNGERTISGSLEEERQVER